MQPTRFMRRYGERVPLARRVMESGLHIIVNPIRDGVRSAVEGLKRLRPGFTRNVPGYALHLDEAALLRRPSTAADAPHDYDLGLDIDYSSSVSRPARSDSHLGSTVLRSLRESVRRLRHRSVRVNQAKVWKQDIVPTLLPSYMSYARRSQSGKFPDVEDDHRCTCGGLGAKKLTITLVRLTGKS